MLASVLQSASYAALSLSASQPRRPHLSSLRASRSPLTRATQKGRAKRRPRALSQNPSAAASAPRGTNRTRACGLAYSNLRLMRAHLRLMRRVLAPLRRCLFDDGRRTRLRRSFADDGRRTRLRALYEDAALVRGSDAAVIGETDPTTVIADRKIADAARRGVFDKLDGQGAPLKSQPHRSAALGPAQRAGAEMAGSWPPRTSRRPRSTCVGASTRALPRCGRASGRARREVNSKRTRPS